MRCLKTVFAAAVLLSLLSGAVCVARCAVMPCDPSSAGLPPCHRHSTPTAAPCHPPLFLAHARQQAENPLAFQAAAAVVFEPALVVTSEPAAQPRSATSPPGRLSTSIDILRV